VTTEAGGFVTLHRASPRVLFCTIGVFLASAPSSFAGETITYNYDPLGRLIGSVTSGGPNTGINTATCFDNAGNRSQYQMVNGSPVACPAPTPASEPGAPPAPPQPPAPPNAVAYSVSGPCYTPTTLNVVQNDTDPGGLTPISVISVFGTNNVEVSVVSSTSVRLIGAIPETDTVVYLVQNSAGATASGIINYTTTGNPQQCANQ
jgi:hypothetical protein